jgi:hypothetical protein
MVKSVFKSGLEAISPRQIETPINQSINGVIMLISDCHINTSLLPLLTLPPLRCLSLLETHTLTSSRHSCYVSPPSSFPSILSSSFSSLTKRYSDLQDPPFFKNFQESSSTSRVLKPFKNPQVFLFLILRTALASHMPRSSTAIKWTTE